MNRYDFAWKCIERPKRIIEGWRNKLFKWDNPILIQRECNKHRNELVLDGFNVVRLLGWTSQYEYDEWGDYYYVVYDLHNGIQLVSCVGGFIWLKNQLSMFDYEKTEYTFQLNTPSPTEIRQEVYNKGIWLK